MNILILGSTSKTGVAVGKALLEHPEFKITSLVRNMSKLTIPIEAVDGDVLDFDKLEAVMKGQDVVVAGLSGSTMVEQAKNVRRAAEDNHVKHIIWMTGMGIHHEITGPAGEGFNEYIDHAPEYRDSTDIIIGSSIPTTILRFPSLTDDPDIEFEFTTEAEQPRSLKISRAAIAAAVVEIVENIDDKKYHNASLGLTN